MKIIFPGGNYEKYNKSIQIFKLRPLKYIKKVLFLKKNLEFMKMCVILRVCSLELIKFKESKKWAT